MFLASEYAVSETHEIEFMVVDGTGSVKLPQFASVGQADILFVRCDPKWLVVGVLDGLWIHRLEGFRCYSEKQPQDVGVRVYYGASECYVEGTFVGAVENEIALFNNMDVGIVCFVDLRSTFQAKALVITKKLVVPRRPVATVMCNGSILTLHALMRPRNRYSKESIASHKPLAPSRMHTYMLYNPQTEHRHHFPVNSVVSVVGCESVAELTSSGTYNVFSTADLCTPLQSITDRIMYVHAPSSVIATSSRVILTPEGLRLTFQDASTSVVLATLALSDSTCGRDNAARIAPTTPRLHSDHARISFSTSGIPAAHVHVPAARAPAAVPPRHAAPSAALQRQPPAHQHQPPGSPTPGAPAIGAPPAAGHPPAPREAQRPRARGLVRLADNPAAHGSPSPGQAHLAAASQRPAADAAHGLPPGFCASSQLSTPMSLSQMSNGSTTPANPGMGYTPPTAYGGSATVVRYFENCYTTGLLTIRIIGASNLSLKGTRLPNAFTAIKLGDAVKFKTKTVWQETSPIWEEEFSMELMDSINVHMQLDLTSYNRIISNELMGTFPFHVDVSSCKSKEFNKQAFKMSSGGTGQITFAYNFITSTERNSDYQIAKTFFHTIFPMLKMPAVLVPLCEALKVDDGAAVAVVRLLNQYNCIHGLIVQLLINDIEQTDKGSTNVLFRTNTAATNLVGHYFRLIGYAYLGNTLGSILNTVVSNPNNYDIDPGRAAAATLTPLMPSNPRSSGPAQEENLDANRARLAAVVESIVMSLCSSVERVPLNIRKVFQGIKPVVEANGFPPSLCIVAIFFLRFIGYALCNPEKCYLSTEVNPEAFKILSTIAKVVQTLVNRRKDYDTLDEKVFCSLKPYFTTNLGAALDVFIEKLLEPRAIGPPDELHSVISTEDEIKFLAVLIRRLNTHRPQIEACYKKRVQDMSPQDQEQAKRAYTSIWNALTTQAPQNPTTHTEKPKRKFLF
ncbi:RasGTPase-activating protein [Pelomyxa schiedti]|nr:RasGTPase-activating protein [Pelomyxa schiedti]